MMFAYPNLFSIMDGWVIDFPWLTGFVDQALHGKWNPADNHAGFTGEAFSLMWFYWYSWDEIISYAFGSIFQHFQVGVNLGSCTSTEPHELFQVSVRAVKSQTDDRSAPPNWG